MGHRPQWHLREPTMDTYIRKGAARRVADGALAVLMAVITPLLEKNPAKALATPASAFVFSMSRLIVLAFATTMCGDNRACVGKRPQQHAIDDAENRCHCADAQC